MLNTTMTSREVCDLIFADYATKKPFLNLDFANVTSTELTSESVFAYGGKGHPKRVQFSGEKGGTLTIETQMQSPKLWQLVTGGKASSTASFIRRTEAAVDDSGKIITLEDTPAADTVYVYAKDDDCGTVLASEVSGNTVTLTNALTANAAVIIYYMKKADTGVQTISISASSFPGSFIVYGDTIMKTDNDEVLPYHMVAYKCAPQGNLSLSFSNSGDPGSITITCDLMADAEDRILDLILIENETASETV